MMSKIVFLCSLVLLTQEISGQYLNYANLQNGLSPNSYTTNIAPKSLTANTYGGNSFGANNLANALNTNNLISSSNAFTGNNLALGNNLASNIVGGQNLATNGLSIANAASSPITAGLFEGISASNGGVFSVTSTSPIYPTGLSVFSDNLLIEGPLSVSGQLPFLSSVAIEGTVPSNGQGAAGCGCGDGSIGIVNELNNAGLYGGLGRPGLGRFY